MGITRRRLAALTATVMVGIAGVGGIATSATAVTGTGFLKINKVVVGSDTTAKFRIEYRCGVGFGVFDLANGEENGVQLPAGTTCVVFEPAVAGFTTTYSASDTVVIPGDGGIARVTVTNTATPPPPPPPPTFSPRTRGYWSNWNTCGTNGNQATSMSGNVLLDAMLPISLGDYAVNTCAPAVAVFSAGSGRFMENQLAAQLLAAEANVKAGASSCITGTIAAADALLASIKYAGPPSSIIGSNHAQRAAATALKDALDRYNNGLGCA